MSILAPASSEPGLFERIAPAIARMPRNDLTDLCGRDATSLAYERLAKYYADAGLHGLAGWYRDRARELETR